MAMMWITTIGLALCLGIVGGVLIYYLRKGLDSEDSVRIDPLPKED